MENSAILGEYSNTTKSRYLFFIKSCQWSNNLVPHWTVVPLIVLAHLSRDQHFSR